MMIENKQQRQLMAKWLISIFIICILIYLGVRHIDAVANAVAWLLHLFAPVLWGFFLALIFNVPMRPIEKKLFPHNKKLRKFRRPAAIALSFLLLFGLFIGIALLVIPELMDAVIIIVEQVSFLLDRFFDENGNIDLSKLPFSSWFSSINIDWSELNLQIGKRIGTLGGQSLDVAITTLLTIADGVANFFIGIAFACYMLYHKEKLKRQSKRFLCIWLPVNLSQNIIHICKVCVATFQHFIAAQAIEALILGLLCFAGMLLLRLPYAPMISALVGVTALLPIVGAYIGALVGAFLLFTVSSSKTAIFLIFLFILQQLEGDWIYPKVIGHRIKLSPLWVLIAITIGGRLCGVVGMFFGVPVCASAYSLLSEATRKRNLQLKKLAPKD